MHIACEKDILVEGLNMTGRTVSSRSTLPIMECLLLSANENGIRLMASDLEMSIETTDMAATVMEPGSVALEAKLFSEIVRKMPSGLIEIEADEQNFTTFKNGRTKFRILGMPGEEYPVMPTVERVDTYSLMARQLKDMIRQTIFSVAVDEVKPILTGELLQFDDHVFNIVAVDGFRMSYRRVVVETEHAPMSVVVPAKSLHELSRILPGDGDDRVTFYFTDKRIVFELPKFTFVSRLLEGNFIRYDHIFNEDFTTVVTTERLPLLTGLERAVLIARENKRSPVRLAIMQDAVVITSSTEMGNSYDEVPAEIDGQSLEIGFNPRYLIEALRAADEEKIILKFTTALSPCIIKGVSSEDFKYLILPLRLLA